LAINPITLIDTKKGETKAQTCENLLGLYRRCSGQDG
jgi:hypothetical protein